MKKHTQELARLLGFVLQSESIADLKSVHIRFKLSTLNIKSSLNDVILSKRIQMIKQLNSPGYKFTEWLSTGTHNLNLDTFRSYHVDHVVYVNNWLLVMIGYIGYIGYHTSLFGLLENYPVLHIVQQ